jgi:predicted enzyme related to lactoylglutathione lyase
VIYLDCADLAAAVKKAPELGGGVVTPVTEIAPHGTIAVVRDPDGNHVGLHTPPAKA